MSLKSTSAYLLNVLAGHEQPTEKDIETVLHAVGCKIDHEDVKLVVKHAHGKSAHTLIKKGLPGLAAPSAAANAGAIKAPTSPKKSPKHGPKSPAGGAKKAPAKEEEEEVAGFSLFD